MHKNKKVPAQIQRRLGFFREDIWQHLAEDQRGQCRDFLRQMIVEIIRSGVSEEDKDER